MHIIVAGSGESSRNNTEALLEDYLSANSGVTLVLPAFRGAFTPPQIHAAQFWASKGLNTILVTREGVEYAVLPDHTSVKVIKEDADLMAESSKYLKGQSEGMIILWNDDDPLSVALLAEAKKKKIKAFDLTNGMVGIVPPRDLKVDEEPNIPDSEQYIEDEEDNEDYDDVDIDLSDSRSLEAIAEVFAKAIAKELKAVLKDLK